MNDNTDNLDERLRSAFGNNSAPSTSDNILDPPALEKRRPRARNPHQTRKIAAGSLLGLSSVAIVGVMVTTFAIPTQAPLFTLAGGSEGVASAEMADSDLRTGWYVAYDYVAGAGLDANGGSGSVYSLELQGSPTDRLSALSAYFGVDGEPAESEYFDPEWPLYVVGSEDWTAPSISVTWNGTGSWFYNNPVAYPEPVCTEALSPEGSSEERFLDCVTPRPSGSLPSAEQATRDAVAIFAAGGLVVAESDIRVLANDDWGIGVSAALVVDGQETALEWTAFWSPGPVLASASGHSVVATSRGVFDTVGPEDAVDRLTQGNWWGSPSPSYYDFGSAAEGISRQTLAEEPVLEPEIPGTGEAQPGFDPDRPVSSDDPPAGELDPLPEPEVPEPEVPEPGVALPELPLQEIPLEPEVITVTVDSSEPTLLLVWDASGNAWLVPGYILRHGNESWDWSPVISVVEGVIEVPPPQLVTIMPVPEPFVE